MFAHFVRTGLSRWMVVGALLVALVPIAAQAEPPVRRPTAPEILRETVERIEGATTVATERIEVLADRAVFRLERAARNGAARASLAKAAAKAKKGFAGPARGGFAQFNREVGNGMIRMRSAAEYTNDLQEDLFFEREAAVAGIQDSVDEAVGRVEEALAGLAAAEP